MKRPPSALAQLSNWVAVMVKPPSIPGRVLLNMSAVSIRMGLLASSKLTMTFQKYKNDFVERFDEQIKQFKTILGHVGLYVGLIAYTAVGAWVRIFP